MFFEENGINAPTNKEEQTTSDKDVDWRYRISNDKLREVTNTLPMTCLLYTSPSPRDA